MDVLYMSLVRRPVKNSVETHDLVILPPIPMILELGIPQVQTSLHAAQKDHKSQHPLVYQSRIVPRIYMQEK
jgi:hypothetical protein